MIRYIQLIIHKIKHLFLKCKLKYVFFFCTTTILLYFFGVFEHIFVLPYDEFVYPYEGNISTLIESLKNNEKPDVDPINEYKFNFTHDIKNHCIDNDFDVLKILFLVKSSMNNFQRRIAIRNTWGYKQRFFDVPTRLVFLLGISNDLDLQIKINDEANNYKDIVQSNFIDSYYNNTIKTMMGFKWAIFYCSNAKFYMFVDDDIYVSVKNVLRFIRNPLYYPEYIKSMNKREIDDKVNMKNNEDNHIILNENKIVSNKFVNKVLDRKKRQVYDFELPEDVRLFAGYVFNSSPHRHKTSKWYVPLEEYSYDMWPPYITAGAYVLSREAFIDMYYTSFYTKHFRFDDIYLGIVAKKANIIPFHCNEFHFYKKDYTKFNYKYVITSHGYDNPDELINVWNEQKALGNA